MQTKSQGEIFTSTAIAPAEATPAWRAVASSAAVVQMIALLMR